MLKFRYKLHLNENVMAKCSRHPRYNPEKDGSGGIRAGCSTCWDIYHLHTERLHLDRAVRDFQRRAAPWTRYREPRKKKAQPDVEAVVIPPEESESRPVL